jgi:hypothetical protein
MSQDFLLNLSAGAEETVKTDITDHAEPSEATGTLGAASFTSLIPIRITNDEFLVALFYDWDGTGIQRPVTCGFAGDPRTHRAWTAAPWPTDTSDESLNWYTCPSRFDPKQDGAYTATKNQARAVYALMLDDIGSKVHPEAIQKFLPTWLIETSPENYQAGYVFDAPVSVDAAERLKKL